MTDLDGIERRKLTNTVARIVSHNRKFADLLKTVLAFTVKLEREDGKEFVAARLVNIIEDMMHSESLTELSTQNY